MKMNYASYVAISLVMMIVSCSPGSIVVTWRVDELPAHQYDQVMVAGLLQTPGDSARIYLEKSFVAALGDNNYQSVAAADAFGAKGLVGLDEANTYLKLCNNGIDVVLTITLVDGVKEAYQRPGNLEAHPASYYFRRIWNYRDLQADVARADSDVVYGKKCFWEIIVYDLNTLQAVCALQARYTPGLIASKSMHGLASRVLRELAHERVFPKRTSLTPRRAF